MKRGFPRHLKVTFLPVEGVSIDASLGKVVYSWLSCYGNTQSVKKHTLGDGVEVDFNLGQGKHIGLYDNMCDESDDGSAIGAMPVGLRVTQLQQ